MNNTVDARSEQNSLMVPEEILLLLYCLGIGIVKDIFGHNDIFVFQMNINSANLLSLFSKVVQNVHKLVGGGGSRNFWTMFINKHIFLI